MPDDMEQDQEIVCRICRCEEEVGRPLFHPCKCSGSIKYVHNDCLEAWLRMSTKAKCEVRPQQIFSYSLYDVNKSFPRRRDRYLPRLLRRLSILTACAAVQSSLLLHQGLCPECAFKAALSRFCLGVDGEGELFGALWAKGEHG